MQVQPYLFFDGRCEEAISYYRRVLGAEITGMMRWKDMPNPQPGMIQPGNEEKVMHVAFKIGNTTVYGSDGRCLGKPNFQGFALTVEVANEGEAERVFAALGDGGQIQMPLGKTFFSPRFGMLADRFGVSWMVLTAQP